MFEYSEEKYFSMKGRICEIQEYVDHTSFIESGVVLRMLGIDCTKHEALCRQIQESYEKALVALENETNAGQESCPEVI